jgi:starvation-inducible DNA-binding protein
MKTNIKLTDESRKEVATILNRVLSDEYLLYTKTRNAHWNVIGSNFSEMHKFFESQYDQVDEFIDEIAERARSLGERAFGSLGEFMKTTRLKENSNGTQNGREFVSTLLADHETIIQNLRTELDTVAHKYGDMGTSDFLTGLMEKHEKMAWMLRAHLDS